MSSDEQHEPTEAFMADAWPAPEWTPDGHVTEPTVHAWLDGALTAEGANAVSAHVAACAACGALTAEVRGVIAGAARVVALLDGAGATVRAEGGGAGGGTRTPPRAWYRRPAVLSLAATLLLAVGVRTVWQGGAGDPRLRAVAETVEAPAGAAVDGAEGDLLTVQGAPVVGAAKAASGTLPSAPAVAPTALPSAVRAKRMAVPSAQDEQDFYGRGVAGGTARSAVAPAPAPPVLPPAPPALSARALAADRSAAAPQAMERAAPVEAPRCLLVEAPASAGLQLPTRMQLSPSVAEGEGAWRLTWLRDDPRDGEPVAFLLREARPDSLAGTDTRALGMAVTLVREGDGWRGTATASGDGAPVVRPFRLRPTDPVGCTGR